MTCQKNNGIKRRVLSREHPEELNHLVATPIMNYAAGSAQRLSSLPESEKNQHWVAIVLGSGREVRRRDDEGKVLGGITIKKAKVILFDDYEVLTNSEGGGTEMKHQTVVPCGSYHPKDWKTGCCEGVGECTNQCSLPYNC